MVNPQNTWSGVYQANFLHYIIVSILTISKALLTYWILCSYLQYENDS